MGIADYFSDLGTQVADAKKRRGIASAAGTAVIGGIGAIDPALRAVHEGAANAVGAVFDAGAPARAAIADFAQPFADLYGGAQSAPAAAVATPANPADRAPKPVAAPAVTPAPIQATAVSPPSATIASDLPDTSVTPAQQRINSTLVSQGLSPREISAATPAPEGRTVNGEYIPATPRPGTYRIGGGENSFVRYGSGGSKEIFVAGDPAAAQEQPAAKPAAPAPTFAAAPSPAIAENVPAAAPDYSFLDGVSRGRAARIRAEMDNNLRTNETVRRGQVLTYQSSIANNLPAQVTAQANLEREKAQAPLYAAQATEAQARATKEGAQTQSYVADEKRKKQILDLQDQLSNETDPKRISTLEKRLNTMQGKIAELYQPITGKDELGNTVVLGVLDKRSGQIVKPESPGAKIAPPAAAIAYLKSNPKAAKDFDEKYGAGAAATALGK